VIGGAQRTILASRAASVPRMLIAIALVALAATAAAVAAGTIGGPHLDGPLQAYAPFHITYPAPDDEVFHWETHIPWNPTSTDMRLRSVELVGVLNVEVVGAVLSYPTLQANGICLSVGQAPGFPPPGPTTSEINGVRLASAQSRTCTNYPTFVVGVRRPAGIPVGTVEGVRVRYEHEGRDFEVLLPSSVELRRP
jgi:hypothetical protein